MQKPPLLILLSLLIFSEIVLCSCGPIPPPFGESKAKKEERLRVEAEKDAAERKQTFDCKPTFDTSKIKTIAVLGPTPTDKHSAAYAANRIDRDLTNLLVKYSSYKVIERAQLFKILEEQGLAAAGITDPMTAVIAGRIAGADAIILGTTTSGDTDLRLVSTSSGEILWSESYSSGFYQQKKIENLFNKSIVEIPYFFQRLSIAEHFYCRICNGTLKYGLIDW